MPLYATHTDVAPDQSRADIERTLVRYGAAGFGYIVRSGNAVVMFEFQKRTVRLTVALPDPKDAEFTKTPTRGRTRHSAAAFRSWEQACKQRWRALLLVIKAKLEAIDSGISTFDQEFLAHLLLPNGQTFGDWAIPQIEAGAERLPKLLSLETIPAKSNRTAP